MQVELIATIVVKIIATIVVKIIAAIITATIIIAAGKVSSSSGYR